MYRSRLILPVIVFAQFCCTSLWFAGNAVMTSLIETFRLTPAALGHLTSAVQFGFISGTLLFAFLSIADRFSPSKVFFISAIFGAAFNSGVLLPHNSLESLLLLRFLTGFSLAGIYPVGMKLAADHFEKGLGTSLGYLVGALVLGTAFPHFLNIFTSGDLPWKLVMIATSSLAVLGGLLILLLVPDGPFRSPRLNKDFSAFWKVFKNPPFRAAAFGYFGHMWELYAYWTFVPVILIAYQKYHFTELPVSLYSFMIIGTGGLACVAGGYLSKIAGTKRTAASTLFLSGCCCLLSPLIFFFASESILLTFLIFWGLVVVADSPLFSTLVAQNSEAESRGTALTIVNSIGFAITIFSIQLLNFLLAEISPFYLFLLLSLGPAVGLWSLYRKKLPVSAEKT
ncbi:MAG: MFS transporter [Salinimicrobium sp.]